MFITTSVLTPPMTLHGRPPPPSGPSQASVHPINGQAHPEPGADLLTQAGQPAPSCPCLINSGSSQRCPAPWGASAGQRLGPAATRGHDPEKKAGGQLVAPQPHHPVRLAGGLQGPAGWAPQGCPGASERPHSRDSRLPFGMADGRPLSVPCGVEGKGGDLSLRLGPGGARGQRPF